MELNHDEVENLIAKIASGKEYAYIDTIADFIVFTQPDNDLKQLGDAVYERSYNKAIKDGLLPMEAWEKLILERGIYTEEDAAKVSKLSSQLEAQRIVLSKTVKVRANQERISKRIDELKTEIATILSKKHSRLILSAESKSEEAKSQYLCWRCASNSSGDLLWSSYQLYSEETNLAFKSEVLDKFSSFLSGLDVATVRYLARHTLWRIRYTHSMKTSEALFGRPTGDYTSDQLNLAYWSNFYDQVYSMMPEDRPEEAVIEDDNALDAYMNEYYKEISNEASIRRGNKRQTKGAMTAFDKEEVIITKSNELYQEIEYDKPREAQKIKDKSSIRKKVKRRR